MCARFIMKELHLFQNMYFAVHHSYLVTANKPFEVTDEADIEFFRSKKRDGFEEITAKLKKKVKKYTKEELFDMYKGEQVKLLKKLGVEEIPRLEKDRVKLILKLQR